MSLLATSARIHDPVDDFQVWFDDLLERRGLSSADALWLLRGEDEDVHSTTVRQWRTGKVTPSYGHLVTIARVFGELPPALTDPLRVDRRWAGSS